MDCGVASMVCLFRGVGIHANYERLREACQTDVDGTSIDTLEDLSLRMGLDCLQHVLPTDAILDVATPRLPALAVTTTAAGYPHFIVIWRRHGRFFQIMDPARGRRWISEKELAKLFHTHSQPFEPDEFRLWAEQSTFLDSLLFRLWRIVSRKTADSLVKEALSDPSYRSVAALDAAIRLTAATVAGNRPAWTEPFLRAAFAAAVQEHEPLTIPQEFWAVRPLPDGRVALSGAVILASPQAAPPVVVYDPTSDESAVRFRETVLGEDPSILAVLRSFLREEYRPAIVTTLALAVVGTVLAAAEVMFLRVATASPGAFGVFSQRAMIALTLGALFLGLLGTETLLQMGQRRIGRLLETRLRLSLFRALATIDEEFIRSRPTSDLAQRAQMIHLTRDLPVTVVGIVRAALDVISSLVALAFVYPKLAGTLGLGIVVLGLLGWASSLLLTESEQKMQAQSASLLQVFQDALLGIVPLKVHGAQRSLRKEHRMRLADWARSARSRNALLALVVGFQSVFVSLLLGGAALFALHERNTPAFLLGLLWISRLPAGAQTFVSSLQVFPQLRLALTRILEPMRGERAHRQRESVLEFTAYGAPGRGASFRLERVCVSAAGRLILEDVNLTIPGGQHIAIVGRSGAGKSTLLSLLLGLRSPASGTIYADGMTLAGEELQALRRQTAWVDPSVQLWNDTFLANMLYGTDEGPARPTDQILDHALLTGVVERLSEGLMTPIGYDGALLSGGEGQRVRVARALANNRPRLVLLDEPFRGLDRDARARMVESFREIFASQTVLFVTHDVEHVSQFDRVLVVEDGGIVEDGDPAELLKQEESRFRELYVLDVENQDDVWDARGWRHVSIEDGLAREASDSDSEDDGEEENDEPSEPLEDHSRDPSLEIQDLSAAGRLE